MAGLPIMSGNLLLPMIDDVLLLATICYWWRFLRHRFVGVP
jgi:hypothetical protein